MVQADHHGEMVTYGENSNLIVTLLSRYDSGTGFDAGGAEIIVYDTERARAYVANGADKAIDILDLSNLTTEGGEVTLVKQINVTELSLESFSAKDITSVAIHPTDDYIAVAVPADPVQDTGIVAIFDVNGNFMKYFKVGSLPDMITFAPDGSKLLIANEGEPNGDFSVDPEGSVTIIDVENGIYNTTTTHVGFTELTKDSVDSDGLERMGGVIVYNITDPTMPVFETYFSSRDYSVQLDGLEEGTDTGAGDIAPEGLRFISADNSPIGKPLLLVANEISGTVAVYLISEK